MGSGSMVCCPSGSPPNRGAWSFDALSGDPDDGARHRESQTHPACVDTASPRSSGEAAAFLLSPAGLLPSPAAMIPVDGGAIRLDL